MIHADEIQKKGLGPIEFSMALVEAAQMPLDSTVATIEQPSSGRPGELNLSGPQVLVGVVSALCTAGVLLWALINLWLFEP